MGIKSVKLGKRSRFLEEQEKAKKHPLTCDLDEDCTCDVVAHPPVPGPANPTSLRGCGCGKWHVPHGVDAVVVDGVEHRYSSPCRGPGGGPLPRTKTPAELAAENLSLRDEVRRLTERMEFLEAALGVLERERPLDPLDPLPPPTSGQERA